MNYCESTENEITCEEKCMLDQAPCLAMCKDPNERGLGTFNNNLLLSQNRRTTGDSDSSQPPVEHRTYKTPTLSCTSLVHMHAQTGQIPEWKKQIAIDHCCEPTKIIDVLSDWDASLFKHNVTQTTIDHQGRYAFWIDTMYMGDSDNWIRMHASRDVIDEFQGTWYENKNMKYDTVHGFWICDLNGKNPGWKVGWKAKSELFPFSENTLYKFNTSKQCQIPGKNISVNKDLEVCETLKVQPKWSKRFR